MNNLQSIAKKYDCATRKVIDLLMSGNKLNEKLAVELSRSQGLVKAVQQFAVNNFLEQGPEIKGRDYKKKAMLILKAAGDYDKIIAIIKNNKSRNRAEAAEQAGYTVEKVGMGSGGVGSFKYLPNLRQVRMQLTYGEGRWNYAYAVIIKL